MFGIESCKKDKCTCKQPYFGDRCEYCNTKSYVTNLSSSSLQNGTFLDQSAAGVSCLCKHCKNVYMNIESFTTDFVKSYYR